MKNLNCCMYCEDMEISTVSDMYMNFMKRRI